MKKRCNVKHCRMPATMTWALVPICEGHHADIRAEQMRYYAKKIESDERYTLKTIQHLTPWGRRT